MADNVTTNTNTTSGAVLATDDISGVHYPRTKLIHGADGVNAGDVSDSNPLPVDDAGGSLTVDNAALSVTGGGVESSALRVTLASDSTGVLSVDDNGASLTVDNAALSVTGGGVEASALRVTIANDSTGVVSVDDNGSTISIDDGGGAITVDGTVAATQSGTWNVANVSGTVSLPTGASTLAEQQTQSTALSAIQTAVQLIDNPVVVDDAAFTPGTTSVNMAGFTFDDSAPDSVNEGDAGAARMSGNRCQYVMIRDNAGNERGLNIDASGFLTANINGTVTVGSHAVTNAGTFAVQVDGAALTALQLIDNIVLAEDAGHSSGDPGVQMLAVRNDSDASLAGTTLDYTPLQVDANGYLKVNIKAGAGSGGTASTDDAAFTAASGSGTPMMGFVTSDSVDSGDVGVVGMLANRQLKVTLYDSGGVELAVGGGTQYTEDAAAAANPVGNVPILVRADTPAGVATTDGDNVAQRGSNYGAAYVTLVDSSGGFVSVGGGTQYDEDAAHSSGNKVTMAGVVRADTAASTSGSDGDVSCLITDSTGRLWCNVSNTVNVASHAVTNAGTFAVQVDGAALTSLQLLDDAIGTFGTATYSEATTKGMMIAALRRDTPSTAVNTDNEFGPLQMNSNGQLRVDASAVAVPITDNSGTLTVDDGGSSLTVDGTVTATIAAGATTIAKAEDVASAGDDVGVPAMAIRKATPANTSGTDGDYEMLQMSAGRLWVDASGVSLTVASHAVTNAGTFAVQVDGSALTALQLIDDPVFTDDGAFTPGTSKVFAIGCQADETATDSVDEGDAGCPRMTLDRKQIVTAQPHTTGGCSNYSALSTAAVLTAEIKGSAGQIFSIECMNNGANEIFVRLYNQTGAPGSGDTANIIWRGIVPGNAAGAGFGFTWPMGKACATGIGIRATATIADNSTSALTADEVTFNVSYK